jgi:hypothetical protein
VKMVRHETAPIEIIPYGTLQNLSLPQLHSIP